MNKKKASNYLGAFFVIIDEVMKWISIIALVITCNITNAQGRRFLDGYIIDIHQDTIHGKIRVDRRGLASTSTSKVRFQSDGFMLRRKFSPNRILGYGYDDEHFVSLAISPQLRSFRVLHAIDETVERQFLRVVRRSEKLTYYESFFFDDDNDDLVRVPYFHRAYKPEMVRVTQGIFGLNKKRLALYFQDCPDLVKAIEEKKLTQAIEVYYFFQNNCK
jgi:hypothetical protein